MFDEEMYEDGDLPQDSVDMRMSPDSTKWWIAGLGGDMFEVRYDRVTSPTRDESSSEGTFGDRRRVRRYIY